MELGKLTRRQKKAIEEALREGAKLSNYETKDRVDFHISDWNTHYIYTANGESIPAFAEGDETDAYLFSDEYDDYIDLSLMPPEFFPIVVIKHWGLSDTLEVEVIQNPPPDNPFVNKTYTGMPTRPLFDSEFLYLLQWIENMEKVNLQFLYPYPPDLDTKKNKDEYYNWVETWHDRIKNELSKPENAKEIQNLSIEGFEYLTQILYAMKDLRDLIRDLEDVKGYDIAERKPKPPKTRDMQM